MTWGLVAVLVLAIAAVAIPIAGAHGDDDDDDGTYSLGFGPPGFKLSETLCSDASGLTLTLKNTSWTTLGSAEITFPGFADVKSDGLAISKGSPASVSLDESKNKIKLRSLGLSKNQSVTITVPFASLTSGGPSKLVTVVKKSSTFSSGEFKKATSPELTVQGCASISGRVFQDWDRDGSFDASGTPADAPLAWSVRLYKKVGSSYSLVATKTAGGDGTYGFTGVATGKDYRVCVKATGADTSSAWALQAPSGNANCDPISPSSDASASHELPSLSGSASGKDFAVVPVTAPIPCGGESEVASYLVQLGNDASASTSTANCDKTTAVRFVHDSFTDGATYYFNFTPAPGVSGGEVLLVEKLDSVFDLAKGQSTVLKYDDVAPFDSFQTMPLCLFEPRQAPASDKLTLSSNLNKSTVLPSGHTSCLLETQQVLGPAGKFTRTDYVFSAVDGGRQVG